MKREQLILGADYYYCTAERWKEAPLGIEAQRIRVTDLGFWKPADPPRWMPDRPPYQPASGQGNGGWILGVEVEDDGTLGRQRAVWIKHLRGPWTETRELVEENRRRREAAEREANEEKVRQLADAMEVVDVLAERGVKAHADHAMPGWVKLRVEDVRVLL